MKTVLAIALALGLLIASSADAAVLKISPNSVGRAATEVEANYSTTHLYVDENAGDSIDITVFFDPGVPNVESAEIFTNLNRRERAGLDADGDGVEDGIKAPNGNNIAIANGNHYYQALAPFVVPGGYQMYLQAYKTGVYRLTARYRLNGDAPGTYRWYSDTDGGGKRDHCIVVSPKTARDIRLYEVNVFNIEASGASYAQRSTFEDLHNAPGAPHNGANHWDLDYLLGLGCNWLWFQPIHPNGIDGREIDPASSNPYDPGSPYAVKNFFEVNEMMTKNHSGSNTQAQNRAASMTAFQNFVAAADAKGVGVMLDAPFNHTGFDAELAQQGVSIWGGAGNPGNWQPMDQIRNREARFYSKDYNPAVSGAVYPVFVDGGENYGQRASNAGDIAPGPDRFDFGKWADVKDVFFGRYDALVEYNDGAAGAEVNSHKNEGDWFDTSTSTGSFDAITQGVWRYFAGYTLHWLDKTGVPAGSSMAVQTASGIDGLRADFGQGLPPQCWEYIINKTRARKWNFVFMAESLDGGQVTYRSSRHFDILNEGIVFPLKTAGSTSDYRGIFEARRTAYGQAMVLLNNTSHDEENYIDPWHAVIRQAVCGSIDGVSLIFPGQELGISTTYGYTHYETNFGKQVPHFKRWNSMAPIWNDGDFGNDQLYPVYQGINEARKNSRALRSSNRYFINQTGSGTPHDSIFSVAKYETLNGSPASSDVVFAFANIDRNNAQSGFFNVNQDTDANAVNDYGIKPGRTYNVKNLAAYTAADPTRRNAFLWSGIGRTGSDILANGIFVGMNAVPSTVGGWSSAPYEAQYLKLHDVTPPASAPTQVLGLQNLYAYQIGTTLNVSWSAVPADSEGIVPLYGVSVARSPIGGNVGDAGTTLTGYQTASPSFLVTASEGVEVQVTVWAFNPNNPSSATVGPATLQFRFLSTTGDQDGDGMTNEQEQLAATNPFSQSSALKVTTSSRPSQTSFNVTWSSVPGKTYRVQASTTLASNSFTDISGDIPASGGSTTSYLDTSASVARKFYRVRVVP